MKSYQPEVKLVGGVRAPSRCVWSSGAQKSSFPTASFSHLFQNGTSCPVTRRSASLSGSFIVALSVVRSIPPVNMRCAMTSGLRRMPSTVCSQLSHSPMAKAPPGKTTDLNSALVTLVAIAECFGSASQIAHCA